MTTPTDIGTFYQGQVIQIAMTTSNTDSSTQKAIVQQNDVYFGIYHDNKPGEKMILSTAGDNPSLTKTVASDGNVTVTAVLLPTVTKKMVGRYFVEMLIKKSDNSEAYPCANINSFMIEPRRLASVIA